MKTSRKKFLALICGIIAVAVIVFLKTDPQHQIGAVAIPGDYPNDFSALGTNMPAINYYSTAVVFKDIFKQSSENWSLAYTNYTTDPVTGKAAVPPQVLDLDENGWVKSLPAGVHAHRLVKSGADYPAGDYTVLYDGEGTIAFEQDAKVISTVPGKVMVRVATPKVGMKFKIMTTNPGNHLRNVRMIAPGTDANGVAFTETYLTDPIYPAFLDQIKNYRVLRFMDSLVINRSPNKNVSDINKPTNTTQGGVKGIAPEYIAEISNKVHADAWINIPHLATDEYIREFATRLRDTLDPSLRVYIEYSNEVWNFSFTQTSYARDQAIARGYGSCYNCFYAMRSRETFTIFEEVFGSRDRLVRVLSSQAANDAVTRSILTFQDSYKYADVLAIAPYFNWRNIITDTTTIPTMDPNVFLDKAELMIDQVLRPEIQKQKNFANTYNLRLITYEGGQHFAMSSNNAVAEYLVNINRMPRMKDVYKKYLNMWKEMGGNEFVHFTHVGSFSKYGSWGSLETQFQDLTTAYKFQALQEFIESTPVWWEDNRMAAPQTEFTTDEDTPAAITIAGKGVSGLPVAQFIKTAPKHGTLSGNLPNVTYTPHKNYNGTDTFVYSVPWAGNKTLEPTVTITVHAVADAPTVNNAYLKLWPNGIYRGALTVNDPDSQTYSVVQQPIFGTVALQADGSFVYTANANYKGSDLFYVRAETSEGKSTVAPMFMSVQPVQDANINIPQPIAGDIAQPVSYGAQLKAMTNAPFNYKLTANNGDHTYTMIMAPKNGTFELQENGLFVYTPKANFNGSDTVTYTVTTPSGTSNVATLTFRTAASADPAYMYPPQ